MEIVKTSEGKILKDLLGMIIKSILTRWGGKKMQIKLEKGTYVKNVVRNLS